MEELLTKEKIESMIYEIRGKKVMLDFELAKIYGYETKAFNQQVQRNIDKFPERYRFQLCKNELMLLARSQNVTAQIWATNKGGRTSLPYAFTVDGIKELQKILHGQNVVSFTSFIVDVIEDKPNYIPKYSHGRANLYDVVKFESGDILLDINVSPDEETIWLTQNDMAILFGTTVSNISMHLSNIFDNNELQKNSVIKKSLTTAIDGKTYNVTYYNLDVVLCIGYRVNTIKGIEFRKWSNKILKQYLIKGYAINNKRCLEHSDIIFRINKDIADISKTVMENKKEIDLKIKLLTNNLELLYPEHFLILDGQKIEADIAYQTIYKLAKESIYIIDDYIDIKTLQLLKCCKDNIEIIIFSDNKAKNNINNNYINDFKNDTKMNISFKPNNNRFHDRYIVIDYNTANESLYHSGASSKDAGSRITTISKINEIEVYRPLIDEITK